MQLYPPVYLASGPVNRLIPSLSSNRYQITTALVHLHIFKACKTLLADDLCRSRSQSAMNGDIRPDIAQFLSCLRFTIFAQITNWTAKSSVVLASGHHFACASHGNPVAQAAICVRVTTKPLSTALRERNVTART